LASSQNSEQHLPALHVHQLCVQADHRKLLVFFLSLLARRRLDTALGTLDVSPYTARPPRYLEIGVGIASTLSGLALLAFATLVAVALWKAGKDGALTIVVAVVSLCGLLLVSAGVRLLATRRRADGGLLSPPVLVFGGSVFLVTPVAVYMQRPEPMIGAPIYFVFALVCFGLAWRRLRPARNGT
jgi:hypothetical protein